jgi:beta-lactamase superfamily II metal-dependent hydrolase
MYNVHLLPAAFGDGILIEYGKPGDEHYILIDGGPYYNFEELAAAIKQVAPKLQTIDLLVITHIDIDHIDGIITLLHQDKLPYTINEVWFNGYNEIKLLEKLKPSEWLGPVQGEFLSNLIQKKKLVHNDTYFKGMAICVVDYKTLPVVEIAGGMELTILSPGINDLVKQASVWKKAIDKIGGEEEIIKRWKKEKKYPGDILGDELGGAEESDSSPANRSSIAFLAKFDNKTCLFAADTPTDRMLKAIEPILEKTKKERLTINAWKLAHHGSKKSTHTELMQKIDCSNILISSDGARYHHPDPECIENLLRINGSLNLFFNYKSKYNEIWEDKTRMPGCQYNTYYPGDGKTGISVSI